MTTGSLVKILFCLPLLWAGASFPSSLCSSTGAGRAACRPTDTPKPPCPPRSASTKHTVTAPCCPVRAYRGPWGPSVTAWRTRSAWAARLRTGNTAPVRNAPSRKRDDGAAATGKQTPCPNVRAEKRTGRSPSIWHTGCQQLHPSGLGHYPFAAYGLSPFAGRYPEGPDTSKHPLVGATRDIVLCTRTENLEPPICMQLPIVCACAENGGAHIRLGSVSAGSSRLSFGKAKPPIARGSCFVLGTGPTDSVSRACGGGAPPVSSPFERAAWSPWAVATRTEAMESRTEAGFPAPSCFP